MFFSSLKKNPEIETSSSSINPHMRAGLSEDQSVLILSDSSPFCFHLFFKNRSQLGVQRFS